MAGLYFEQFSVGQKFVHDVRRTVLDMDNLLFSALTYRSAAVHIDHHYAASTEFGKPLVNSIFTLGLVIGLSIADTTLGTTVANLGMSETVFPKPVFAGDTIRVETVVIDLRPSKSRPTRERHSGTCRPQSAGRGYESAGPAATLMLDETQSEGRRNE